MKNYWLDRKKKKDDCGCSSKRTQYLQRRLERHRGFMKAMATGGSVEVDWDAVEKQEKDDRAEFNIPEIPPMPEFNFPTEIKLNPPEINIPPIVFGPPPTLYPCIDIGPLADFNIPTEIKLVAPDPMPSIQVNWAPPPTINLVIDFPTTIYCGTAGPVDPIPQIITINSPGSVYTS